MTKREKFMFLISCAVPRDEAAEQAGISSADLLLLIEYDGDFQIELRQARERAVDKVREKISGIA